MYNLVFIGVCFISAKNLTTKNKINAFILVCLFNNINQNITSVYFSLKNN